MGLAVLCAAFGARLAAAGAEAGVVDSAALCFAGFFLTLAIAFGFSAWSHRASFARAEMPRWAWTMVLVAAHLGLVSLTLGALVAFAPLPFWLQATLFGGVNYAAPLVVLAQGRRRPSLPWHEVGWRLLLWQLLFALVLTTVLLLVSALQGPGPAAFLRLASPLVAIGSVALQVLLKRRGAVLMGLDYNTVFHLGIGIALWMLYAGLTG